MVTCDNCCKEFKNKWYLNRHQISAENRKNLNKNENCETCVKLCYKICIDCQKKRDKESRKIYYQNNREKRNTKTYAHIKANKKRERYSIKIDI